MRELFSSPQLDTGGGGKTRVELYVHIPFCRQKCRYCDFVSLTGSEQYMSVYLDGLLAEAGVRLQRVPEPLESIYIGGGTPSLLPVEELQRLLSGIHELFQIRQDAEWTTEANPGTLSATWLKTAVSGGVNRLSLGMQAAQDRLLRMLGRIHSMEEVRQSVHLARSVGIRSLNLDLMFGLPEQTFQDWQETLEIALTLSPEHLSVYGLIPEKGTPLYADLLSGRLELPDVEAEREMYEYAREKLSSAGYEQYEISNWALPGYSCRHNIGYWRQHPYLGLGVSAASMTLIRKDGVGIAYLRETNTSNLSDYLARTLRGKSAVAEAVEIRAKEARFETVMLGLRMTEGIRESDFSALHGVPMEACWGKKLQNLQEQGLLKHQHGRWFLTERGMDIQNAILVELMEED